MHSERRNIFVQLKILSKPMKKKGKKSQVNDP